MKLLSVCIGLVVSTCVFSLADRPSFAATIIESNGPPRIGGDYPNPPTYFRARFEIEEWPGKTDTLRVKATLFVKNPVKQFDRDDWKILIWPSRICASVTGGTVIQWPGSKHVGDSMTVELSLLPFCSGKCGFSLCLPLSDVSRPTGQEAEGAAGLKWCLSESGELLWVDDIHALRECTELVRSQFFNPDDDSLVLPVVLHPEVFRSRVIVSPIPQMGETSYVRIDSRDIPSTERDIESITLSCDRMLYLSPPQFTLNERATSEIGGWQLSFFFVPSITQYVQEVALSGRLVSRASGEAADEGIGLLDMVFNSDGSLRWINTTPMYHVPDSFWTTRITKSAADTVGAAKTIIYVEDVSKR